MGEMLTGMIEEIASGKGSETAEQQMIKLGVAKLPEVQRDNTDRKRTSPFALPFRDLQCYSGALILAGHVISSALN